MNLLDLPLLGGIEGDLEVVTFVGGGELVKVEGVRMEAVDEGTERQTVRPARREVVNLNILPEYKQKRQNCFTVSNTIVGVLKKEDCRLPPTGRIDRIAGDPY